MPYYKHTKTNKVYKKISDAINKDDDSNWIVYTDGENVYVRSLDVFYEKFIRCGQNGEEPETITQIKTLHDLDLSVRATNALVFYLQSVKNDFQFRPLHMTILDAFNTISVQMLSKSRNVGKRTLDEIVEVFSEYGLDLRVNSAEIPNS